MYVTIRLFSGLGKRGKGRGRRVLRGFCGWTWARWIGVASALVAFALLAPSGAPPPAPEEARAAVLPSGFSETVAFSGLTEPTVVRFAGDGRVFVAEKSGVIKVFDNLSDTTPTLFTDLHHGREVCHGCTTSGIGACSGWRSIPTSRHTLRVRAVRPRRGDRRHGPAMGHCRRRLGRVSDPARGDRRRLRDQWSALASAGRRQRDDGLGAGAGRRLVPAVPEPLDRDRRVRPGRRALRNRRGRCQLQLRRLRAGRKPAEPLRRPARWGGGDAHAAERGGRRPAESGPAYDRRPGLARWIGHPRRPLDRGGTAQQPARRKYGRKCAEDDRLRPAQSLPVHLPPRNERALDRRRRLERLRGDRQDPRPLGRDRRELRLALLRGQRPSAGVRLGESLDLRDAVRRLQVPIPSPSSSIATPTRSSLPSPAPREVRPSPASRSSSRPQAVRSRPPIRARSSSRTTPAIASG